ncbi:metallophosphoesterase 1-like [Ctenocephalides felis]|uniref:metallophosphoesterase 1-like n=1 Tax=Ctenocephalides felis TaxID=7515 RepID=UPI000E6E5218|nr:metallophosphoesterase 1-like [Ctenocephalides felis]
MEMDNCYLCNKTEALIEQISDLMKCWNKTGECFNVKNYQQYSRPVLIQHFPLYRLNEELCFEWDSATGPDRTTVMKEKYDCLSKNASNYLYNALSFREAWSGHTHYGCIYKHSFDSEVLEYTVASFNYRNRNDPNYILAYFTPESTFIYKCAMPTQATIILFYIFIYQESCVFPVAMLTACTFLFIG